MRLPKLNIENIEGFGKVGWYWVRVGVKRFWLFFYCSGREFIHDHCLIRAAALTYFTLLSLIPFLVILFAFFKAFGGESLIDNTIKPLLFEVLSTGTGESISGAIDELISRTKAGALGSVGFIFLILTSFSLMEQTESTINAIWGVKHKRSFIQRWVFYWAALTIFPLLVGLSISATAYLGSLKGVQEISQQVVPYGYRILPVALQGLAFFLFYLVLPRTRVRFFSALAGAFVASIMWEFLKKAYLLYTSSAISYNLIYGSLAVLPLFMIWLFISWLVALYGAELAYAWQNFRILDENRKTSEVSSQLFEAVSLDILLESTRSFIRGEKAFDPEKFSRNHNLPYDLVNSAVNKLVSAGILKHLDGQVILLRDPEGISVNEALEAIRTGGAYSPPFANSIRLKRLSEFLGELEEPSREVSRKWNMKQLLQNTETTAKPEDNRE